MLDRSLALALFENLEKLIALSAISQVINIFYDRKPKLEYIIRGLVFGIVGVFIMLYPYTLETGITFDSRSILLSLTGLLYSFQTTLIVTSILLIFRIFMGGSGVYMGSLVILSSALLGVLWKTYPKLSKAKGKWYSYYTLGIAVHVLMCVFMLTLPKEVILSTFINIGIPVVITYPFVTIIIGKLLSFQLIQKEQQQKIIMGEKTIRRIYDNAPIGIVNLWTDTKMISMNPEFCSLMGFSESELIGQKLIEFVILDDMEQELAIINQMKTKKIDYFSDDRILRRKDGTQIWTTLTVSRVEGDADIEDHFIATVQDITRRKESEILNDYLVYHDYLTGAYNLKFLDEKETEWQTSGDYPRYFICIDVNNLRIINDAFGFKTGDELLKSVYNALFETTEEYAHVVRLKSNEFLLYIFQFEGLNVKTILESIHKNLASIIVENIEVSVSIGVSEFGVKTNKITEAITLAEENMRNDKLLSMDRSVNNTIDVIMKSLFAKNSREMLHSQRVSSICQEIAKKMKLDKYNIEKARIAGLMHDIGKIGIPEAILDKPFSLTLEEIQKIQEHTIIGYRILSSTSEFSEISDIILSHHERWDGNGYPRGLMKDSIPLFARIISIADTFDAMTSERPYREPFSTDEAMLEIKNKAGSQFDPEVAGIFIKLMSESTKTLFDLGNVANFPE